MGAYSSQILPKSTLPLQELYGGRLLMRVHLPSAIPDLFSVCSSVDSLVVCSEEHEPSLHAPNGLVTGQGYI